MSSLQLTDETFSDFVSDVNPYADVHCWSAPNGHDDSMRTRLAELIPQFSHIAFAEFEIDLPRHMHICVELNVQGPPFLALYRRGSLVETRVGLLDSDELRLLLLRLLQPNA